MTDSVCLLHTLHVRHVHTGCNFGDVFQLAPQSLPDAVLDEVFFDLSPTPSANKHFYYPLPAQPPTVYQAQESIRYVAGGVGGACLFIHVRQAAVY